MPSEPVMLDPLSTAITAVPGYLVTSPSSWSSVGWENLTVLQSLRSHTEVLKTLFILRILVTAVVGVEYSVLRVQFSNVAVCKQLLLCFYCNMEEISEQLGRKKWCFNPVGTPVTLLVSCLVYCYICWIVKISFWNTMEDTDEMKKIQVDTKVKNV